MTVFLVVALLGLTGATYASPLFVLLPRQAVTALISPPAPPPAGCTGSWPTKFGIAVVNISLPDTSSPATISAPPNPLSQMLGRGEKSTAQTLSRRGEGVMTVGMLNQIQDGQVQGGLHTQTVMVMTTATVSVSVSVTPVSEIGDGQLQNPGWG